MAGGGEAAGVRPPVGGLYRSTLTPRGSVHLLEGNTEQSARAARSGRTASRGDALPLLWVVVDTDVPTEIGDLAGGRVRQISTPGPEVISHGAHEH